MGTLKWWAKQDNPKMYEEIMENSLTPLIDVAMRSNGSHADLC